MKVLHAICVCTGLVGGAIAMMAQAAGSAATSPKPKAKIAAATSTDPGDQAFRHNCSRCHYAPEQLSPRITGTVLQHMRVRANLSAADEKLLLKYLAP